MNKDNEEAQSDTRKRTDKYGDYVEEKTSRGWRKIKRIVNDIEFWIVNPTTDDYIKAVQTLDKKLMVNTMSDRLEINGKYEVRPMTDFDESVIFNRLNDYGLRNEGRMRRALHQMGLINHYHPVKKYLDSLEWDGKDHFAALMNKLEMSSPIPDVFWRKFLIGSIAKAIDGHQNFMLVLLGGQGKGKSRLVRWLCPVESLFNESAVNPENKDDLIALISNWIWEVAELDATTRRADRSALKHFISRKVIDVRVPYGRYPISKKAVASMVGTINPDGTGFLQDPSGNRRFAVIYLDDIDWSYTDIDINQLWAQLYDEYKSGAQWELTKHEQEIQHELNKENTFSSPLEQLFNQHFEIDLDSDHSFAPMDILSILKDHGLEGKQYNQLVELSNVMTKNGIIKKRVMIDGRKQTRYVGVKLSSVDIKDMKL